MEGDESNNASGRVGYTYRPYSVHEMEDASNRFLEGMRQRRSVRSFSDERFPIEVIHRCIAAAGTAPSGAHRQPWHFVVVESSEVKARVRAAAEEEERAFYETRAPEDWLDALAPLGTNAEKSYLEVAPYLVVLFAVNYTIDGQIKSKNYYVSESVGIAAGMFITAVHQAGLCTLTHTPSPMGFLSEILDRPSNERPYLLMPVGFPTADATVPDLERKPLSEIMSVI